MLLWHLSTLEWLGTHPNSSVILASAQPLISLSAFQVVNVAYYSKTVLMCNKPTCHSNRQSCPSVFPNMAGKHSMEMQFTDVSALHTCNVWVIFLSLFENSLLSQHCFGIMMKLPSSLPRSPFLKLS